jgi:ATP-dependent DNA helicase UvrD/PcrA
VRTNLDATLILFALLEKLTISIAARLRIIQSGHLNFLSLAHLRVKRLAFDGGVRLFAVGDADQSVYGFTGADGALLLELAARPDVEDVRLQLNHRSAGRIIRASELVLQEARGYQPRDPARQATMEDQAAYVMESIIPAALAAKPGRRLGDIALLYRAASVGDVMAEAATAAGFDFIRVDNAAPYKKVGLTSWIEDCAAWCAEGWRQGKPQLGGLISRWLGFRAGRTSESAPRVAAVALTGFLTAHRAEGTLAAPFVGAIRADLVDPLAAAERGLADQYEQVRRMDEAFSEGGKLEGLISSAWVVGTDRPST